MHGVQETALEVEEQIKLNLSLEMARLDRIETREAPPVYRTNLLEIATRLRQTDVVWECNAER